MHGSPFRSIRSEDAQGHIVLIPYGDVKPAWGTIAVNSLDDYKHPHGVIFTNPDERIGPFRFHGSGMLKLADSLQEVTEHVTIIPDLSACSFGPPLNHRVPGMLAVVEGDYFLYVRSVEDKTQSRWLKLADGTMGSLGNATPLYCAKWRAELRGPCWREAEKIFWADLRPSADVVLNISREPVEPH